MMKHNNLNEVNMGLATGIISAGCMLVLSLGTRIGFYTNASTTMQNLHMFYNPSFLGTITGMIEAGIMGFVIAYLLIKVYNMLQK